MKLIKVMVKVSNVEYNGKRVNAEHKVGELVERGDWIYINPDKLLGITIDSCHINDPLGGILPFKWIVYALLDSPHHTKLCLGECASMGHAQQVIDELPVELTGCEPSADGSGG